MPKFAQILYYIGGFIAILGVLILVLQNWPLLPFVLKILITLGLGIVAFISALLLEKSSATVILSGILHLASVILLPIGLFLYFDHFMSGSNGALMQTFITAILLVFYLVCLFKLNRDFYVGLSVVYGTWLFFAFTNYLVGNAFLMNLSDFYLYRALVAGVSYLALGYGLPRLARLQTPLYFFGTVGVLGSAIGLSGFYPRANVLWEVLALALIFTAIFISLYLKRRVFLFVGMFFLLVYIVKITGEYFRNTIGWPLALVLIGVLFMAVGYVAFYLNNKYLTTKNI